MKLEIFDVEHGACALVTTHSGGHVLIDCGSSPSWQPGTELTSRGIFQINQLIVTNCDEDHVSGLPNLLEKVAIKTLLLNPSLSPLLLKLVKFLGGMGPGIKALIDMMERYTVPAEPTVFGFNPVLELGMQTFYNTPETYIDTNNLSLALFLNIDGLRFFFPGDLECAGWKSLHEKNFAFRTALAQTDIFVASHHGRENGINREVFFADSLHPQIIVISDKQYEHETQKTVGYYHGLALGANFKNRAGNGVKRHVLTTRNDGHLRFIVDKKNNTWTVASAGFNLFDLIRSLSSTSL